MPAKFLFVNEDEVSFTSVRPKRTSTSVRRHVRLQRGRVHVQQKQQQLQMRVHPAKALQTSSLKGNKIVSSHSTQNAIEQPNERICENSTNLSSTPEPLPGLEISRQIGRLNPDAQKLINFYFSCEGTQQAFSRPDSTTTWPTLIVRKALESERHTLFLLCYITSIISHLNHSTRDGKLPKQSRNGSLSSETSSCSSSAPSFDDWLSSVPTKFKQDPYTSHLSRLSLSYAWRHSTLTTSAQPWYTSPNSPLLDPTRLSYDSQQFFQTSPPFSDQEHPVRLDRLRRPSSLPLRPHTTHTTSHPPRLSFPDPTSVLASCSSLASNPIHLTHQAVSTLKSRLSTNHKASPATEFLFPVWCLFRAAILQGDEFAAAAHERFLRHLVYKSEGVSDLPSWLIRVIVEVDLKLGDTDNGEDVEEKSGGELLVESEMRERMVLNPDNRVESKEKDCWWDMGWS